jgi:hypothetical protein
MVSSKDIQEAKKICAGIRQANKELLDHLYAQAAEAGIYPLPHRVIDELSRILKGMIREVAPPQPPHLRDQPGISTDVTDLEDILGRRLYRDTYHDAVDAYFRHRPGLEIKKRKPGPKPNVEQIERILKLYSSKSYREIAKEELQAEPEREAKDLLIEKERERVRAIVRRARRRNRT